MCYSMCMIRKQTTRPLTRGMMNGVHTVHLWINSLSGRDSCLWPRLLGMGFKKVDTCGYIDATRPRTETAGPTSTNGAGDDQITRASRRPYTEPNACERLSTQLTPLTVPLCCLSSCCAHSTPAQHGKSGKNDNRPTWSCHVHWSCWFLKGLLKVCLRFHQPRRAPTFPIQGRRREGDRIVRCSRWYGTTTAPSKMRLSLLMYVGRSNGFLWLRAACQGNRKDATGHDNTAFRQW